ncbi:SWIM zinc finger family protein, partial [Candidatus Bathyarchaeota archaeon]|nr:SWIM zinc finger family protein [Candidatus Bathyarchaeota archaeon]
MKESNPASKEIESQSIKNDGRQQRGLEIANLGNQVRRIDAHSYKVRSQSNHGEYDVLNTEIGWLCSCPDSLYRGVKCKHIHAVVLSQAIRKEAEVRRIEPITQASECIYCGSQNIVRDGIRKNKFGDIQKFNCKGCGRYFT